MSERERTRLLFNLPNGDMLKKLAHESADRLCADIYEVKAAEKTDCTAGFWWCGRYGMHRWICP